MKLTKSQLKQIIKEELAQVLDESDQYARTGAEASLKPPFHTEEVNGVIIAPITNAGKQPHNNPQKMQEFAAVRAKLKQVLETGVLPGIDPEEVPNVKKIYIEPMWGRGDIGDLMVTTKDGKTVKIPLATWRR